MSDQQFTSSSLDDQPLSQSNASAPQTDDEFEEITSDEVDRIVATLDELIEICHSENIKYYLEEAASNIYQLVYEDEETETDGDINEAA